MVYFNKKNFKSIVLDKYKSYEKYSEALEDIYGLKKGKEAVTKWGQESNNNVPTAAQLPIIAKSLGLEISDLYDDATEARNNITSQELQKDPLKYLDYFIETIKKLEYSDEDINLLKDALSK